MRIYPASSVQVHEVHAPDAAHGGGALRGKFGSDAIGTRPPFMGITSTNHQYPAWHVDGWHMHMPAHPPGYCPHAAGRQHPAALHRQLRRFEVDSFGEDINSQGTARC